jgi:hypothetical protein
VVSQVPVRFHKEAFTTRELHLREIGNCSLSGGFLQKLRLCVTYVPVEQLRLKCEMASVVHYQKQTLWSPRRYILLHGRTELKLIS